VIERINPGARSLYRLPQLSWRWWPIWRRNFLVWKKFLVQRVLGNIADPLITLVAFGYGLGSLLPSVQGLPYILFLASGTVSMSTMNSAKFESLFGAFSRMHAQRTWDALLNAPLSIDDVVLGELCWAAAKAAFTGVCILGVVWLLGISREPLGLLVVPILLLIGASFSAMALVCNAVARDYDFFTYYFTLVVTPMTFLSGVFFPISAMPEWLQWVARALPLASAVDLVRPLILGHWPSTPGRDILVLVAYLVVPFYLATVLTRRRLAR
jgi:lipooligosaccharide transport system permease protein